jgi:cytochrome c553
MKKVVLSMVFGAALAMTASATDLYKPCAGCHGASAEKKALGKSEIIKGWASAKTVAALKGYKDGTYGAAMKGVMKGQVAKLSDADMKTLGDYIQGLK